MAYYRLFYHLVWATKNRAPLLTKEIEPIVFNYLRVKAIGIEGIVYAINGVVDHVHMVVSIPPKLAVAKFVGQVKGVASAKLNQLSQDIAPFYWQDSYGAFSFDSKRLPHVVAYVERQKEHHAARTIIPVLERTEADGRQKRLRESDFSYLIGYDDWYDEMIALSA